MIELYTTPVLEADTSKGHPKFWRGFCFSEGDAVFTQTEYWQATAFGEETKHQFSEPKRMFPKNAGRANETLPSEQGISEVKSAMKKQRDHRYHDIGVAYEGHLTGMLAKQFAVVSRHIKFPTLLFQQPKCDGCRCTSDGKTMWSRTGLDFQQEIVAHLVEGSSPLASKGASPKVASQISLLDLLAEPAEHTEPASAFSGLNTLGYTVDGELILPFPAKLQDTMSAVEKYGPDTPTLLYWIYDVVLPDVPFEERTKIARRIVEANNNPNIRLLDTYEVHTEDEIMELHEKLVAQGWEGSIIRQPGVGYKPGHRDSQLLKLKDWEEEEFLVTAIVPADVEHVGGMLECVTEDGKTFNVTPKFPFEKRRYWLNHPEEVVGKRWTVRFQAWSNDGIPTFARGMGERITALQG